MQLLRLALESSGLTLGGVFTAISQGVPAGISALVLGLQPIVTSTLANRFMGEKIARSCVPLLHSTLATLRSRSLLTAA